MAHRSPGGAPIPLADDSAAHHVRVVLGPERPRLHFEAAHAGGTEFTVSVDHVDREWQLSMIVIEPRSDGRCVAFTLGGWLYWLAFLFPVTSTREFPQIGYTLDRR